MARALPTLAAARARRRSHSPGDWIGDLTDLEVLTLGANGGVNEEKGADSSGFMGTLPEGLSSLNKLVELDLQARARGRGMTAGRESPRVGFTGRAAHTQRGQAPARS
jgi:hypothetical protein